MRSIVLVICSIVLVFAACRKDDPAPEPVGPGAPAPVSPVVFDLGEVPYPVLSTYNFFEGELADMMPVQGVLPFEPLNTLFTDYAHKKRFVWMPVGAKAQYAGDGNPLDFDDGSVLIKHFYYDRVMPADERKIIETRLLFRRNGQWEFADYVWNAEQTEALLDMTGATVPIDWLDEDNVLRHADYRIPTESECFTCHKNYDQIVPIGTKPMNLRNSFAFADGLMDQLAKWQSVGYLEANLPPNIVTPIRWDDETQDLQERVRAYVDINCAHCHSEGKHCDYRPIRYAFSETADPTNLGVCVEPTEDLGSLYTFIVTSGNVERSSMHYRMASDEEQIRMPLLGRSIAHDEAVQLVEDWINSLSPPCN